MTWSRPVFPPPPGRFELCWLCRFVARCGAARPLRGCRASDWSVPVLKLIRGGFDRFHLGVSAQRGRRGPFFMRLLEELF